MTVRSNTCLLPALLGLCAMLALAAPAPAQDRRDPGSPGTQATLRISFGATPRWSGIQGTRIREIRERDRPDYDMFLFQGTYYVFSNDSWYTSRHGRGQFVALDERFVPREFSRIPREHWRHYPAGWMDRNREGRDGREARDEGNDRRHSR